MMARFRGGPLDGTVLELAESTQEWIVEEPVAGQLVLLEDNPADTVMLVTRGRYRRDGVSATLPSNVSMLFVGFRWQGWDRPG